MVAFAPCNRLAVVFHVLCCLPKVSEHTDAGSPRWDLVAVTDTGLDLRT